MARNKHPEETISLILNKALDLFLEKGYNNTSIQDIINNLGGLSKGAIYHHFKSKEEIFLGVCHQIGQKNELYFSRIRDDKTKNGSEKLKIMLSGGYSNPQTTELFVLSEKFVEDDKFFKNSILEMFEIVIPYYIEPLINEGIKDGSIQTTYPKELSEIIIIMTNIFLNPFLRPIDSKDMRNRMNVFHLVLKNFGIHIIDEDMIQNYVNLIETYQQFKNSGS